MASFLRYKQEVSGFPRGCDMEEQKAAYIDEYEKHQGIRLRYDKILKNPGMKKTAKIAVKSYFDTNSVIFVTNP